MLSEQIRENQDIFFSCQVEAQPAVKEIVWLHNERPINETHSIYSPADQKLLPADQKVLESRVIVSNDSLVLQRVQLDQRGQYACMAANSEGIGLSNQIDLRVLRK